MADTPLDDSHIAQLQALLDSIPAPLEPLDVTALDGFLCGVLLQPIPMLPTQWLPHVADIEGRPLPAGPAVADLPALHALVLRRHAELAAAIGARQWFDPWVFDASGDEDGHEDGHEDGDADTGLSQAVLPWVAGFAAAMDLFPALMQSVDPAIVEPLALLYLHFDADDLEDADALLAVIETIEPPADLAEAVQDMVRAVMLMADVTRPRAAPRSAASPGRPAGAARRGRGRAR